MSRAQNLRVVGETSSPNDLEAFWLPFTANRAFKQRPRLVTRAKDMHYYTPDGRAVLDGAAGLWCCNAGHNRDEVVAAIQAQAAELDFAPSFQFGHPKAFALASRIAALAPGDLDHVFFCNSGSEAVDTALKIALAYWNISGQGQRTRLIGRERGYHGVGFGGISVGGVVPDMITFAKAVNSGTVPMAGVIVRKDIHDAFMRGPDHAIEFFHGYTYSAHPLACAAALAAQDIYRDEKLFERARALEPAWADAIMTLKGLPNVLDIRTLGLVAAIDLASKPDAVGARAFEAMERAFHDIGIMFRVTGDTIALTPPLIVSEDQIGEIVDKVGRAIKAVA